LPGNPTSVVLSPHLDDAVLSLWHLLAAAGEVSVVTVFAGLPESPDLGERSWDRLTGADDSTVRMQERRAEDATALALAGRTPLHLDFLEGQYRDGAPPLDEVIDRLRASLPGGARVVAPAALDGHRTHREVRAVGLALGADHELVLYADVPHATRYGWPAWVSGAPGDPHLDPHTAWADHLRAAGIELDALRPQVHRLDDATFARKLDAVRCYRTQVPALEAEFGVFSRPDVLRYEVLWPLG
jgi:hypothetical protein